METIQLFFRFLLNSYVIPAARDWEHWDESSWNHRIVGNWKGLFEGHLVQTFSYGGGQLSRPQKGWNPLVSLPFLLAWVSTASLISRASHRQPVPVWWASLLPLAILLARQLLIPDWHHSHFLLLSSSPFFPESSIFWDVNPHLPTLLQGHSSKFVLSASFLSAILTSHHPFQ